MSSYEIEKLYNIEIENNDFKNCLSFNIPEGQTFKGFPMCFNHINTQVMFNSLLQKEQFTDILDVCAYIYLLF